MCVAYVHQVQKAVSAMDLVLKWIVCLVRPDGPWRQTTNLCSKVGNLVKIVPKQSLHFYEY